uniref:Ubiquitin-like domain-containing protein n=1 Tax=Caenorhabditis tropicalis TaxID=1561998 RepID=A0A1I7TGR7_9PELO
MADNSETDILSEFRKLQVESSQIWMRFHEEPPIDSAKLTANKKLEEAEEIIRNLIETNDSQSEIIESLREVLNNLETEHEKQKKLNEKMKFEMRGISRKLRITEKQLEESRKKEAKKPFQIFIKMKKTITLDVENDYKISHVIKMIEEKTKMPSGHIYLCYQGKPLQNELLVSDYNIRKESTLFVYFRASGCRTDSADN